jgi:hypothetical protein
MAVVTMGEVGYRLDAEYQVGVHNFWVAFAVLIAANFVG